MIRSYLVCTHSYYSYTYTIHLYMIPFNTYLIPLTFPPTLFLPHYYLYNYMITSLLHIHSVFPSHYCIYAPYLCIITAYTHNIPTSLLPNTHRIPNYYLYTPYSHLITNIHTSHSYLITICIHHISTSLPPHPIPTSLFITPYSYLIIHHTTFLLHYSSHTHATFVPNYYL